MANIEYAILESTDGKFYPGAWVTTMERDGWFKPKKEKRTFYTFTDSGILYWWVCGYEFLYNPLQPYNTLEEAKLFLSERNNKSKNKFHPYP